MHKRSIFIFRRDLRVDDNTGLRRACEESHEVVPCFFVDPRQATKKNSYRSVYGQYFLAESLKELSEDLHSRGGMLYLGEGECEIMIKKCIQETGASAVYLNRDYTPFSRARDEALEKTCQALGCAFISCGDALLHEPEEIHKHDKKPYTVFTPFWKMASTIPVRVPKDCNKNNFCTLDFSFQEGLNAISSLLENTKKSATVPGRSAAEKILAHIKDYRRYESVRDVPELDATTHLSPHLKFGTISIREAHHAITLGLGEQHPLLRQLYWRDFFHHIAWHFPHVFGGSFYKQYDKLKWSHSATLLQAWKDGCTGFPIVDAGMRELRETGNMHNRVRMITASFLVKDLHIDWRIGEQHFATLLTDYDPCVNNGNWQWAASTGCDAVPYFRIFNPWIQQKKFDPECAYIKKWIPELRDIEPKVIHKWDSVEKIGIAYPAPVVDHSTEAAKTKSLYASL